MQWKKPVKLISSTDGGMAILERDAHLKKQAIRLRRLFDPKINSLSEVQSEKPSQLMSLTEEGISIRVRAVQFPNPAICFR
jgi:hypothetical protein